MVDGGGQFKLILCCLVVLPCSLSVSLLLSKSLVLSLEFLELLVLAGSILVLEHSSHASDGGSLLSVISFLLLKTSISVSKLLLLFVAPVLLLFSLVLNALVVEEILTLELGAS